jgi:rod shape-determining protein MreC
MEEEIVSHRKANYTFLLLFTINIFLLTANLTDYIRTIKNFVYYVLYPSSIAAVTVVDSADKFSSNIGEIVRIHQENLALKETIKRLSFLEGESDRAKEENQRLRALVAFPAVKQSRSLVAHIISREPDSWFQWITIDKGQADGIYLDAPVLAWADGKPGVLGRVVEVYSGSAKVVLITNILSAVPGEIKGISEDGLIEGQNSHKLKINYLMSESKVRIGDEIVTSPLSSVFPPGIAIGKVTDFSHKDNEAFQTAVVKPSVNFNNLREAVVMIQDKKKKG